MSDDSNPPGPVFLERRSYRRRRLTDAARFLPVLGIFLFLIPLLWKSGGDGARQTSRAIIYIFGVWGGLIVAAACIAVIIGLQRKREDAETGR